MILILLAVGLSGLEDSHRRGDYERVVELAPSILADSAHSRADSVQVLLLKGSALVGLGRNDDAGDAFRALLRLDPDHQLDPERVSPKIRAVFEGVRRELPVRSTPPADTVYLSKRMPLSLLVPGLDQFRSGRPGAGSALIALTATSLAGLAVSHFNYQHAREEYLAATAPDEIEDRYAAANRWYQSRTVFAGTAVLTWLSSLVDGLLND